MSRIINEYKLRIGDGIYDVCSDDKYVDVVGGEDRNFEPHMVQLFKSLIKPEDVVFDIGANIGLTAILFSKLSKSVFAFEPSPTTFNFLKTNLSSNNISNAMVFDVGIGDKDEDQTIVFNKDSRSVGFISDHVKCINNTHVEESIRIETLDGFCKREKVFPNFIKIDVEGFEKNVIMGASEVLKKCPTVVLELNHFCLNCFQRTSVPDFLDFLMSVFPFVYAVDIDNVEIVDLRDDKKRYDVMYSHIVHFRFSNLVCCFDENLYNNELVNVKKEAKRKRDFTSGDVTDFRGSLQLSENKIISKKVFEIFHIEVEIHNSGRDGWVCYGTKPVCVSYHWVRSDGTTYLHDGRRTRIGVDEIEPGMRVSELVSISAPDKPGDYDLIITLVLDSVSWFEDKGFSVYKERVSILQ